MQIAIALDIETGHELSGPPPAARAEWGRPLAPA
jgi:hypothetical protein